MPDLSRYQNLGKQRGVRCESCRQHDHVCPYCLDAGVVQAVAQRRPYDEAAVPCPHCLRGQKAEAAGWPVGFWGDSTGEVIRLLPKRCPPTTSLSKSERRELAREAYKAMLEGLKERKL